MIGVIVSCSRDDLPTAPAANGAVPLSTFLSQLDSQIDPTDSYVVATMTAVDTAFATSTEPLYDPSTGGTATSVVISTPPDSIGFQTGFNAAGDVVSVTQFAPEPDLSPDPSEVVTSRIVGNVATDYNAAGQPVYDTPAEAAAGPEMMGGLNSVVAKLDAFSANPLYPQMTPNNPFRTVLNSTPENFVRVGIVSHSDSRWVWVRMYGDNRCAPEADCGGRNSVKRTQRFHKHAVIVAMISSVLTVGFTMIGQPELAVVSGWVMKGAVSVLVALNAFDLIYHEVVSPGDQSDGLAPVKSQHYPNSDRDYDIFGADSHVGATRSDKVQREVFNALAARALFAVTPR